MISSKLRWACRRGMLELDILLGNFLEEAYLQLSEDDQKKFVTLLNEANDQELFEWLTGKKNPTHPDFAYIVNKIRYHAEHRHSN